MTIPPAHRVETSAGVVTFHDEGSARRCCCCTVPGARRGSGGSLPLLAARFRVIAPDLPGAGSSIPVDHVRLDVATHVRALGELLATSG